MQLEILNHIHTVNTGWFENKNNSALYCLVCNCRITTGILIFPFLKEHEVLCKGRENSVTPVTLHRLPTPPGVLVGQTAD